MQDGWVSVNATEVLTLADLLYISLKPLLLLCDIESASSRKRSLLAACHGFAKSDGSSSCRPFVGHVLQVGPVCFAFPAVADDSTRLVISLRHYAANNLSRGPEDTLTRPPSRPRAKTVTEIPQHGQSRHSLQTSSILPVRVALPVRVNSQVVVQVDEETDWEKELGNKLAEV